MFFDETRLFIANEKINGENSGAEASFLRNLSITSNCINALLGVSIFAMPWGFQQSGLLGGIIISLVVALLSFETVRMLLAAQRYCFIKTGQAKNYPEIAEITLGRWFSLAVKLATIISCLGSCTGYIIFFGETLGQVFHCPSQRIVLMASVPLILLSWIRSFQELAVITVFGVIALYTAIAAIVYDGSLQYFDHRPTSSPRIGPGTTTNDIPLFVPQTILTFLGPATFLFTIHYCILSMGSEYLTQQAQQSEPLPTNRFTAEQPRLVLRSEAPPVEREANWKVFPSQGFQEEMEAEENSARNEFAVHRATGVLANRIISDKKLKSERFSLLRSGREQQSYSSCDDEKYGGQLLDSSFVWDGIAKSLAFSYLFSVLSIVFVGSVGFILFVNPNYNELLLIRDSHGVALNGCEESICQNIILNITEGYLRDMIGITISISILVSYVILLAPAREHIEQVIISVVQPSSAFAESVTRSGLRTLIVASTIAVAISNPYFGAVLGTIGGLTDAFQCFVLPPLIYRSMLLDRSKVATASTSPSSPPATASIIHTCTFSWWKTKLLYSAIFVLGLVIIAYTAIHGVIRVIYNPQLS
eukprot:gene31566-40991_t